MELKELALEKTFKITFADKYENKNKYMLFANHSQKESYKQMGKVFIDTTSQQKQEERYHILLNNLRSKKTFNRQTDIVWICKNCGYIHIGTIAPDECPICRQSQSCFEAQEVNY